MQLKKQECMDVSQHMQLDFKQKISQKSYSSKSEPKGLDPGYKYEVKQWGGGFWALKDGG